MIFFSLLYRRSFKSPFSFLFLFFLIMDVEMNLKLEVLSYMSRSIHFSFLKQTNMIEYKLMDL